MNLDCYHISSILFKSICFISTVFMVGFWVLKFNQNEDVSAITYVSYENEMEVGYPEMSICITMPFIYQNLSLNLNINVSANEYSQYLNGNTTFREEYRTIDYNNVTLNLLEHVQEIILTGRNKTAAADLRCKEPQDCPQVKFRSTFNGTSKGNTVRCFGFEIDRKTFENVVALTVIFKPGLNELLDKITKNGLGQSSLLFSYPGQLLKSAANWQPIWKKPNDSLPLVAIKVSAMEILRRRNKHGDSCLLDWAYFDNMVMKNHDDNATCKAPYQTSNKPLCTTITGMADSMYNVEKMRSSNYQEPCEEMSSIVFSAEEIDIISYYPRSLKLIYIYPEKTKIIQQVKSVDLHALIGNLGGYIGLFLGKNYSVLLHFL